MGIFDSSTPAPAQPNQPQRDSIFGGGSRQGTQPSAPPPHGSIFGGSAPPPPALDTGYGAVSGSHPENTPFGHGAQGTATNVGRALDAQGWATRKALTGKTDTNDQMTAIRHHIPGLDWFYNDVLGRKNPAIGPNLGPLEGPIQGAARGLNHAAQGLIDASLQTALDPLTYETAGFGRVLKVLSPAAKAGYIKAINSTPATQALHARLLAPAAKAVGKAAQVASIPFHWGGNVAMERGPDVVQMLRGAGARASATGSMVEQHIIHRFNTIVDGLNPKTGAVIPGAALDNDERMRVSNALNGDLDPDGTHPLKVEGQEFPTEVPNLTPKEHTAYRQLRTLTALNFHLRQQAAEAVAVRGYVPPADRDAVHAALRKGVEPTIPEPGKMVRTPYGEPVPRSRGTYADPMRAFVQGLTHAPTNNKAMVLYQHAIQGMTPTEMRGFNRALIDNKAMQRLEPSQQALVDEIKRTVNEHMGVHPVSTQELQPRQRVKVQPENQAAIDEATRIRDHFRKVVGVVGENLPFREKYMPFPHPNAETEGRPAFTHSPTQHFDPQAMHREDQLVKSPEDLRRGFEMLAANTGRQVETRELHSLLGTLLDDPKVEALFTKHFPATGAARDWKQKMIDGWMGVVGYPRAATVSILPRHGINIYDLAVNTVPPDKLPQFTAEVARLTKQLLTASPREYRALTQVGRELGATSGKFMERKAFFQRFPDWGILGPLRDKETNVTIGGRKLGLGAWTKANNKLVWAIDDAVKQVYAQMMRDAGEAEGLRAGGLAQERMVDYERLSPFQKALRYVAPFGTFRGGIPGAVLGGIVRNPARAAFYNRLSGNTMYGGNAQTEDGGSAKLFNPTADVGKLGEYKPDAPFADTPLARTGIGEYARSTLAYPVRAALNLTSPKDWWDYGQGLGPGKNSSGQPDPGSAIDYGLSGVPELESAAELSGLSHFRPKSPDARQRALLELYRQAFGIGITPPP
jgi:hypothetical protein